MKNSDEVLKACEFIISLVSGELIALEDFLETSSTIEKRFKDDKKYSVLMHQFQKIQRDIIPSLENCNMTYNAMLSKSNDVSSSNQKGNTKDILAKQKEKVKVFDLDYHLEKTKSR